MKILSEGIAIFEDFFLRSEELIALSEEGNWRNGTAGEQVNHKVRITDVHDMDSKTELHGEVLQVIIDGINQYSKHYKGCNISQGENLRVARYPDGGFYSLHSDSARGGRTLSAVLFLNDDFEGGQLRFENQDVTIEPKEGMLVLFPSNFIYIHECLPVKDGNKYCVVSWFK
jgi:predicted 2-oxoglutarate/Fe(II)-dependent dioxygenase YbiX